MSTVKLKKPYNGHQAGETISVPYGKGRELTSLGLAVYPDQPNSAPAQVDPGTDALKAKVAALEAENKELRDKLAASEKKLAEAVKK